MELYGLIAVSILKRIEKFRKKKSYMPLRKRFEDVAAGATG
jgi:hypothetical protein